jgi:hypothetical protein
MWTLFDVEFAGPDARHEGSPLLFREMENRAVRVGRVSQVNAASYMGNDRFELRRFPVVPDGLILSRGHLNPGQAPRTGGRPGRPATRRGAR